GPKSWSSGRSTRRSAVARRACSAGGRRRASRSWRRASRSSEVGEGVEGVGDKGWALLALRHEASSRSERLSHPTTAPTFSHLLSWSTPLSQPQVNYWIHRLLPVLQVALDRLGVRPERDPRHFAQSQPAAEPEPRLIAD